MDKSHFRMWWVVWCIRWALWLRQCKEASLSCQWLHRGWTTAIARRQSRRRSWTSESSQHSSRVTTKSMQGPSKNSKTGKSIFISTIIQKISWITKHFRSNSRFPAIKKTHFSHRVLIKSRRSDLQFHSLGRSFRMSIRRLTSSRIAITKITVWKTI